VWVQAAPKTWVAGAWVPQKRRVGGVWI
jgi:hypothetical protein